LYALSGAPVKILELANFKTDFMGYQSVFRTMEKHEQVNHVTTCSIQTKNNVEQEMHIQDGHAYSVVRPFPRSSAPSRPSSTATKYSSSS
jgi:hypothetical protein